MPLGGGPEGVEDMEWSRPSASRSLFSFFFYILDTHVHILCYWCIDKTMYCEFPSTIVLG